MPRIALSVEYNGANYQGWQRQPNYKEKPSIQELLENALSNVADSTIEVCCAGRTDRGVHATEQIVHFDFHRTNRKLEAWLLGGNSLLPNDISINWVKEVPADFHARFSAIARRYNYYFYYSPVPRGLLNNRALWIRKPLDTIKMQKACDYLIGEQDFSALRSSQCESKSPYRNVIHAIINSHHNFIVLDIKANAFLHHMVRNIVGCLLEIGFGNKPAEWMLEVLQSKDRTKAAKTAAPDGLYLVEVSYPQEYSFLTSYSPAFILEL